MTATAPKPTDDKTVARLERLAWALDASLPIPFTRYRFGLDALLGLIPGIGDALGAGLGTLIVVGAWRLGTPWRVWIRMLGRLIIETLIGSIPLLGDLFDIGYQANRRNVAQLIAYLRAAPPPTPRPLSVLASVILAALAAVGIAIAILLGLIAWSLLSALFG